MKRPVLFNLSSRLASNDTIDSVLRYRELGRAKDLSAPWYFQQISGSNISQDLNYHDASRGFPQYLHGKARRAPLIRIQPFPFISSTLINYTLQSVDQVQQDSQYTYV